VLKGISRNHKKLAGRIGNLEELRLKGKGKNLRMNLRTEDRPSGGKILGEDDTKGEG